MSKTNWKNVERKHSTMLSCAGRVGPTGLDLPDSYSDLLTLESKCTNRPPVFVQDALQQGIENTQRLEARDHGGALPAQDMLQRLPIVVIHEDGTAYDGDLVVMRMDHFMQKVLPALQAQAEAYMQERYD